MARLKVSFDDLTGGAGSYDGFDATNLVSLIDGDEPQPLLVWVTSDDADDAGRMKVVNETVLKNEKVALGLKMFETRKIDASKVQEGSPMHEMLGGRHLPRMVVLTPDGQKVGSVEGKDVSISKLYSLMKRGTSKVYKTKLDSYAKEYVKLLAMIDKIESKKEALAKLMASPNNNSSKTRKLEKQQEALTKEEAEIHAKEAKLLAFEIRKEYIAAASE